MSKGFIIGTEAHAIAGDADKGKVWKWWLKDHLSHQQANQRKHPTE